MSNDPNGDELWTYDSRGNLLTTRFMDGATEVGVLTQTYDADGNPLTRSDADWFVWTSTYDALGRLSQQTMITSSGYYSQPVTCDSVGNMLRGGNWDTRETSYDLAGRQLTMVWSSSLHLVTFVYDGNDNQVSAFGPTGSHPVSMSMVYDYENRLVVVNDFLNSEVSTYTYSGDGLKRSEAKGSSLTTLVWDGSEYLQGRE